VSLAKLQDRAVALSGELRETTARLIEKRAWAAQLSATSLEQRQALNGWKQLVMKAGKRKGKRAPRLLAEARRLMPVCQTAVPVWIMPLSLVVESFSPRRNRFDVVIIDEASQANILALAALYLGDQVIVVGDHEQVSPEAVGQRIDEVQRLIDMLLPGIPNRELYDGQTSIYHLAQTSFGGAVMLREHFRCVPAIIQFSNLLSYHGKIRPLRDDSDVKVRPPTLAYRVNGNLSNLKGSKSKTNPLEAKTVAALLLSAAEQPEYASKTFGVISMVGTDQAMLIDSLLQRHMDPGDYVRRRVLCGNPAQFQGDERDVVFLSMVDSPNGDGPLPLRADPGDRFKKRFNVAASRPRDQLWVVHSVDPDVDLKPDDLRRRLILHAKDPYATGAHLVTQESRTESEFERRVLTGLVGAGYRVTSQWPVGAYRIDLVVEGGDKRLAVECDGERFHTTDNLASDMGRQLILERLGWRFLRIRGSQFFRDPEGTLAGVIKQLMALGITADGVSGPSKAPQTTESLQDRVVRRAARFLADWGDDAGSPWATSAVRLGNRDSEASAEPLPARVSAQPSPPSADLPTRFPSSTQRPDASVQLSEPGHSKERPVELRRNAGPLVKPVDRVRTPRPITSHRPEPESDDGIQQQGLPLGDSLVDAIRREGLEAMDKRSRGGALWVIGGPELVDKIERLAAEEGCTFNYSPNGGRATKHRPSWWTSGVTKKGR
jgi:very-short-patch-repair endonuclease